VAKSRLIYASSRLNSRKVGAIVVDSRTLAQARRLAAEARKLARLEKAVSTVAKGLNALALARKASGGTSQPLLDERGRFPNFKASDPWPVIVVNDQYPPARDDAIASALRDDGYSEPEIESVLTSLSRAGTDRPPGEEEAWISEIRAAVARGPSAATTMDGRDQTDEPLSTPMKNIPPQSARILRDMPRCGATWEMKQEIIARKIDQLWKQEGNPYRGDHDSLVRAVKKAKEYREMDK